MAAETYYLLGTKASGINHLDTTTTVGTEADDTNTSWAVDATNALTNEYSDLYALVARASTTFTASAKPSTIDTTNGNGWRLTSAAKSGTYPAGDWSFSFRIKGNASTTRQGRVSFLLWKSANADGSSGSAIGTAQVSSTSGNIGTGSQTLTATYDPGEIALTSEYLFLLCAFQVTNANNTVTIFFRPGGATHSLTTTDFATAESAVGTSTALRTTRRRRR